MKKLIALTALTPGAALAHGTHVPMAEVPHGTFHALLPAGLLALAVLLIARAIRRTRP